MLSRWIVLGIAGGLLTLGCGGSGTASVSSRPHAPSPKAPARVTAIAHTGGALFVAKTAGDGPAWVEKRSGEGEGADGSLQIGGPALDMQADRDVLWVLEPKHLHRVDVGSLQRSSIELPVVASAVAAGYGTTAFVGEAASDRVWVVGDGQLQVLAEGPPLKGPQALIVQGGRLLVGGTAGLQSIDLADGTVTTIADDVGAIRDIVLDPMGYAVVALEEGGLLRVGADGTKLPISEDEADVLAFDATTRTLYAVEGHGASVSFDYVALVGDDPERWQARDARPMQPFVIEGVELSGAEYWPYRGDEPPSYPADILWGFYPEKGVVFDGVPAAESATAAAVDCAERSYEALRTWAHSVPQAFWDAVAQGRTSRFFLWVNDYSEASESFPHEVRPGRFWYWERRPAVLGRVPGYWKWETTLTPDGRCLIPEPAQIDAYLADLASNRTP